MRGYDSRRSSGWFTGTLVLAALFWLLDLLALRAGVPDPLDDSWEYGAVARSLLAGHGFRTPVIHPPLWTLRDAADTVPVLVHGPLLPLALAPFVALFGPGVMDHVAWFSALFALMAAVSVFRLGERTMSAPVGAAAAGLLTVSPFVIRAVHHDVALTCGAWLLAFALDQLLRTRPHGTRAGLALGMGILVRPEFLLAMPMLHAFAGESKRRFTLVTLACLVPWMWHGVANAGSPFFNLSSYLLIGYWGPRPGIGVMRDFALPPKAWSHALAGSLMRLPAKWLDFLPHALKRVLMAPSGATGWLAPLGALAAIQNPRSRPLAILSTGLGLVPLAIMTWTLYDPRYVTPFVPVLALGAARGASELVEWLPRWARRPRAWIGLLLLLVLPSTGTALNDAWREARAARPRLATERAGLKALAALPASGPVNVVYSDTPDFVAWTLARPALWVTREEYLALPARTGAESNTSYERPRRSTDDVRWFHAGDGRGAALGASGDSTRADSVRTAPRPVPDEKPRSTTTRHSRSRRR